MRCPKCQFDHESQTTECLKCGIIFARYQAALEAAAKPPAPMDRAQVAEGPLSGPAAFPAALPAANDDAEVKVSSKQELLHRALALPLALLGARLVVGTNLRAAVRMLSMMLHETGHAVTAWLTGIWAIPMLWVTMHGEVRSYLHAAATLAAIGFGGFRAWMARRWAWVFAAGAVLIVHLILLIIPAWDAGALIVFGGDGGCLALATILMAMFYAGRKSPLHQNWGLRWGLLVIGALTFMDVYRTWSGPWGDLPFGELEGVNLSDPSLLTEMYGWSVPLMVERYIRLARVCLVVLAVLYVWGLLSTYRETRSSPTGT